MGKEKFKPGMRCFVEGVISETNGAKDYPISVAFGGSSVEVTFTDTGLYRTTHSAPSLFTSEEVAAKLHPDLAAEIERLRAENERLASRINELETIDNGIYQKLELAELQIAQMNEAHGHELEKLNAQIQLLGGIIIKIAKQ